jgi:hypothetical protein
MMTVVVRNPLVAHVWRLMPGWNVYRNWYLGRGAFVARRSDVRGFVKSYVETEDASAAIGSLFSATERLLRGALRAEGEKGAILNDTLPNLLGFCVSPKHKYLNLPGMCCDVRSVYHLNSSRIGAEHGDYRRDQIELSRSGWKPSDPEDPDPDYLKIVDHRLLSPHLALCGIFNRIDPETGRFERVWEPHGFAQCETKLHTDKGELLPEQTPSASSTST